MADFLTSHMKTMGAEGGFANNPDDKGGMTYKGIASNFWPNWNGWRIIKAAIAAMTAQPHYGTQSYYTWAAALNKILAASPALQSLVVEFYKTNFWGANRLGEVESQVIADWLYDHAVNTGSRGNRWVQEALDLPNDGVIGKQTIRAINGADSADILAKCKTIAGAYRLAKIKADPSQKQFAVSWLLRDGFSDKEIKDMLATV